MKKKLKVPYQGAVLLDMQTMPLSLSGRFELNAFSENQPFIDFLDTFVDFWNSMYRWSFARKMKDHSMIINDLKTAIMSRYHVKGRVANAIVRDVWGTIKAAIALKEEQVMEHQRKVEAISEEISKLETLKEKLWKSETWTKPSKGAVPCLRNIRRRLVALKKKRNRYQQKIEQMNHQIETGEFPYCFGSSKLLKMRWTAGSDRSPYRSLDEWRKAWHDHRNRHIYFIGSSDEVCGCGLFQLRSAGYDYFNIRMMSPFADDVSVIPGKNDHKAFLESCIRIPYRSDLLEETLQNGSVAYTLIRRKKGWYLHPSIECEKEDDPAIRYDRGCIGLDINAGFITKTVTTADGDFISAEDIYYTDEYGTITEAVKQIIAHIFQEAAGLQKSVAIENISLTRKKNSTVAKKGKVRNRMLSTFPYRAYRMICERASVKYSVPLHIVDPAYTSKIGKDTYMDPLHISVHQAAAYVIARRALGFVEQM